MLPSPPKLIFTLLNLHLVLAHPTSTEAETISKSTLPRDAQEAVSRIYGRADSSSDTYNDVHIDHKFVVPFADVLTDKREWPDHWEVATITYYYSCPNSGEQTKELKIDVNFDGAQSIFRNKQNAEKLGKFWATPLNDHAYTVTGSFNHGICLAVSDSVHCGYSISGTLIATTDENAHKHSFRVADKASGAIIAPEIIERCSLPNGPGCPADRAQACKFLKVTATG